MLNHFNKQGNLIDALNNITEVSIGKRGVITKALTYGPTDLGKPSKAGKGYGRTPAIKNVLDSKGKEFISTYIYLRSTTL